MMIDYNYKYYIPDDEEYESLESFKERFSREKFASAIAWPKRTNTLDWEKLFYNCHRRIGYPMMLKGG